MIKVFWFDNSRNKCISKGKSTLCLKKKISEKFGTKCYICNKQFDKISYLELEHKIPTEIGGRIFCESNLRLACNKCHQDKTSINKIIYPII